MNFKHRPVKKKYSIGIGTSIGVAISIISCILLAAVLTTLTLNETFREEGMEYAASIILLLSSLAGALFAGKIVEERKYLTCLMTVGTFTFLLLGITILFFGSAFHNMLLNLAMVLIGGGISILINTKKKKRTVRKATSRRIW